MNSVEREGIIIGAHAGVARIRLEPAPACSGCASRGTCASAADTRQIVEVRLSEPAVPGARVTLSLPESSVALASLLGYLLPAVGLLLGAAAASWLAGGDSAAVVGAFVGLFSGLLGVRFAAGLFHDRTLTPVACLSSRPGALP